MAITGKDIRDHWMIISAVVLLAVGVGAAQVRLGYAESAVEEHKKEVATVKEEIVQIRIEATRVATAAEAQKEETRRQIDQLIQAVERIRDQR